MMGLCAPRRILTCDLSLEISLATGFVSRLNLPVQFGKDRLKPELELSVDILPALMHRKMDPVRFSIIGGSGGSESFGLRFSCFYFHPKGG